ncbi:MAG: hypothetical protein U1D30_07135 [Planctomycetota bacterium]
MQVLCPASGPAFALDLVNVNNLKQRPDGVWLTVSYDGNIHAGRCRRGRPAGSSDALRNGTGGIRAPVGAALLPQAILMARIFIAQRSTLSWSTRTATIWGQGNRRRQGLGRGAPRRRRHRGSRGADGSVYFGLNPSFTDPYLLQEGLPAKYSIEGEKGTSSSSRPDFKSREIFCTVPFSRFVGQRSW